MAFKTPKTILTRSKEDIDEGLWCKGTLARYGTDSGGEITEEELENDYSKEPEGHEVKLRDKAIGCALGLVSMYAGLGEKMVVLDSAGKKHKFFVPRYPHFADGEGVTSALRALYCAIPAKQRCYDDPNPTEDEIIESIHKYNDQKSMGVKRASKWFERALATL